MMERRRVILDRASKVASKGIDAMTPAHDVDWPAVLADRLTTTHPDVLGELLSTFIHTLMGVETDICAAPDTVNAALSAPTSATDTAIANSIPAQDH
jgi:putative transposase